MKIKNLMEGAEPKLPGAVSGIKIMTPQQFVAKSAEGEEPEKDMAEDQLDEINWKKAAATGAIALGALGSAGAASAATSAHDPSWHSGEYPSHVKYDKNIQKQTGSPSVHQKRISDVTGPNANGEYKVTVTQNGKIASQYVTKTPPPDWMVKEQGVAEATKLPADTRELKGQELEDYLDRIRNQEKSKTDKYKLPYIHRSSVMGYYNEEGKKYNTDAIKQSLRERPKKLLKQNEKMKHSNGELEQFFNVGFAALVGIALDENTNELIVVNTCPGAGSCKVDCFAMKGGKIQFAGPWLSDGRILTYLLNDPTGFFNQLDNEIKKEESKGDKGGYTVTIRWHDAGDFFSPEYVDLAFKLAAANPDVMFYAYTKMGDVVLANKPANFMINWSEGAHTSQEKKVKAADPSLGTTKNSRIVPSNLFYDLLVKDEKKNLVKGPEGQWQVIPDKLPELKQRLAKQYSISPSSILSYDEWDAKTQGGKTKTPVQYNVIITPGEPDITAKSAGVLSTLLLKH